MSRLSYILRYAINNVYPTDREENYSINTEKNTMRILTTLSSKILWGEKTCMFISNYGHRNHHYTKLKHSTPCSI